MSNKYLDDLVRFHVLDVLAWLLAPDWNNRALKQARYSAMQLRLLLKITGANIETRQEQLGMPIEER